MPVTVYTTPSCVQCETTKRFLDRNAIPYVTVDLSEDVEALAMVKSLGYSAAPVVVTENGHWSGFRPDNLKSLLSAAA
jgi:glutaredoxin-like protein NrdH